MSSVKEIQAVHNACAVVEAVAERQPVGVSELARATGLDKSTTQRVVITLHRAGWLVSPPGPSTRWQLAVDLVHLARHAGTSALVAGTRPVLESLRDATGESVLLALFANGQLTVHDVVESRAAVRMSARVGARLPVARSASGRVVAAHLGAQELADLRRSHADLDSDRALTVVRRRGWAASDREVSGEVRSVGAPLLDAAGRPLGAVVVSGPVHRISPAQMRHYGRLVAETVTVHRSGGGPRSSRSVEHVSAEGP